MGVLTSIINAILALWQILKLGKTIYSAIAKIQHDALVERTAAAIRAGDNIRAEQGLGNPDAGKPSGIGEIREKGPK